MVKEGAWMQVPERALKANLVAKEAP